MADAVWPAELTSLAPQLVSWTKTEPKLTERTQMSAGPAKVRRRFTAGVTMHSVELVLTRTQLGVFREFWTDTVKGGSLAFEWREWETQDDCEYRFITEPTERPLRPRGSGTDDHWVVSFQLEQLPAALPDPGVPATPDNEPPSLLLADAVPDIEVLSDEFYSHQDTDFVPTPADPDEPPSIFEITGEDTPTDTDVPLPVSFDDVVGAAGAHGSPHDLAPAEP